MRSVSRIGAIAAVIVALGGSGLFAVHFPHRKHRAKTAVMIVQGAEPGCRVDVDGEPAGLTNTASRLTIDAVDPSPHYVHVSCASEPTRTLYISSLVPGQRMEVEAGRVTAPISPLEAAQNRMDVRSLLGDAVNLRSEGRFPQAIQELHKAVALQPENPNLHHELGTTFLMFGQWEDARVELIETLRYDENDADAHNALGFAYEKLGDIKDAADQYGIAARLDPQDDSYHRHYLEALALLPEPRHSKKKQKK
jgi:tetratricopeptide (TPR) repeat protein